MPEQQLPYEVFRQLTKEGVNLRASADFGDGLAAALWERNETADTRYNLPDHHTLSLYVAGGEQIRKREGSRELRSFGAGSLCLMPESVTTDWHVAGRVELFHLYIPKPVFDRTVAAALGRDPARVTLREQSFFADPTLEQFIRLTFLQRDWRKSTDNLKNDWRETADRLALSHAGHFILAHLIGAYSNVDVLPLVAKSGLLPRTCQRIDEYIDANLYQPLTISELANVASLSEFHFARMFKTTKGETPHAYVLRRRLDHAISLLKNRGIPLAQIAQHCGFSSQSHFSAAFKKRTGMAPRRYRELASA